MASSLPRASSLPPSLCAVYVLDTGVRWSHVDFSGRVGEGANFVGGNSIWDDNGHGTHVSGGVAGSFLMVVAVCVRTS